MTHSRVVVDFPARSAMYGKVFLVVVMAVGGGLAGYFVPSDFQSVMAVDQESAVETSIEALLFALLSLAAIALSLGAVKLCWRYFLDPLGPVPNGSERLLRQIKVLAAAQLLLLSAMPVLTRLHLTVMFVMMAIWLPVAFLANSNYHKIIQEARG